MSYTILCNDYPKIKLDGITPITKNLKIACSCHIGANNWHQCKNINLLLKKTFNLKPINLKV